MSLIRSPLGALGALMVFLQGIAAAALVPLADHPDAQKIIVWAIVGNTSFLAVAVVGLVAYLARTNPVLLFNPQDIDRSVHSRIYAQQQLPVLGADPSKTLEITIEPSEGRARPPG